MTIAILDLVLGALVLVLLTLAVTALARGKLKGAGVLGALAALFATFLGGRFSGRARDEEEESPPRKEEPASEPARRQQPRYTPIDYREQTHDTIPDDVVRDADPDRAAAAERRAGESVDRWEQLRDELDRD